MNGVCELYRRVLPVSVWQELIERCGLERRSGVYTPQVVWWLMMYQRLDGRGTLETAVEQVVHGEPASLLNRCKRVREATVSPNNSRFCRARQEMPKAMAENVTELLNEGLKSRHVQSFPGLPGPAYLMDGAAVSMEATAEIRANYPPAENQHGKSHWSVLRAVVAHDVLSGLALKPVYGPMYGKHAVSEQGLAEQLLAQLPARSTIIHDRNFGTFAMVYAARKNGHEVVVRLTGPRVQRLIGGRARCGERRVVWRPSAYDLKAHPELPAEACIEGRVLISRMPGRGRGLLILFTTLELPADQVRELYRLRWNVETDLRSIKRTLRMYRLTSRTPEMAEKELLAAICAYNLVRTVMCLAAELARVKVRELSFTGALGLVFTFLPDIIAAPTDADANVVLQRLARLVARRKLPRRKRRRSFPRAVWARNSKFPRRAK